MFSLHASLVFSSVCWLAPYVVTASVLPERLDLLSGSNTLRVRSAPPDFLLVGRVCRTGVQMILMEFLVDAVVLGGGCLLDVRELSAVAFALSCIRRCGTLVVVCLRSRVVLFPQRG